jgi:hypothetical protein
MTGERREDPVLRHARREAIWITAAWAAATVVSCLVSYFLGYSRDDRPLGPADIRPILGMPRWFFWGVIVPWLASGAFIFWFAGFVMVEDDLGSDHSAELERDIREGAEHHD